MEEAGALAAAVGEAPAAPLQGGEAQAAGEGKKWERKPREVVLGPDGKPLSRNAVRKLRRDEFWAANVEKRKEKRKEKMKVQREKKRARIEAGDLSGEQGVRRHRCALCHR
jgi:hypothetical protein